MRTAKSCGPDTPTLVSSLRIYPQATVANKPGSPGRARRKPLKPLRREGRTASAEPVCSCALSLSEFARETAGAARTRSSLLPLFFEGCDQAQLGRTPRRGNADVCPSSVMPRLDRGIQYAAASPLNHYSLWNTGSPGQAGRRHRVLFEMLNPG